jgi:chaperonin GroEL (HSP60 family)
MYATPKAYCIRAYADALEIILTMLAKKAGLNPTAIFTELQNGHALGEERNAGIDVRKSVTFPSFSFSFSFYSCERGI